MLDNQILVAAEVTREAADKQPLVPMAGQVERSLGAKPTAWLADGGDWSEEAVSDPNLEGIEVLVPPDRAKPGAAPKKNAPQSAVAEAMWEKLRREEGKKLYRRRQQTIEPVFGQIKQARGLRPFQLRGATPAHAAW